jgi:hypothetical protein
MRDFQNYLVLMEASNRTKGGSVPSPNRRGISLHPGLRIAPELTGSAKPTEPTMNFSRIRKLSGGGLMEWCG